MPFEPASASGGGNTAMAQETICGAFDVCFHVCLGSPSSEHAVGEDQTFFKGCRLAENPTTGVLLPGTLGALREEDLST